mgnify:FL=1
MKRWLCLLLVLILWGCEGKTTKNPPSPLYPLVTNEKPVEKTNSEDEERLLLSQDIMEVFSRILSKPMEKITKEDLQGIRTYIPKKEDDHETVLKILTDLEELYLNPGVETEMDLSLIRNLPNLKVFTMSPSMAIDSLDFLTGLEQLERLRLDILETVDFQPLSTLKQLKHLQLSFSNVEGEYPEIDLSQLPVMENLEKLELEAYQFHHLDALKNFPKLKALKMGKSRDIDLRALQQISQLESVELPFLIIESIDFMQHMPNLKHLDISYNSFIKDLSPLQTTLELESLNIYGTNISDLSPLANLPKLEYLNIANSQVTSIEPLLQLPNLKHIILNKNKISDWEKLLEIPGLLIEDYEY